MSVKDRAEEAGFLAGTHEAWIGGTSGIGVVEPEELQFLDLCGSIAKLFIALWPL